MTPTARTLALLRRRGFRADVCEHRLPRCCITRDLFGFADLIYLDPERGIVAVQVTTTSNRSARRKKMAACPGTREWLTTGGLVELWAWRKRRKGRRMLWTVDVHNFTLRDVDFMSHNDALSPTSQDY